MAIYNQHNSRRFRSLQGSRGDVGGPGVSTSTGGGEGGTNVGGERNIFFLLYHTSLPTSSFEMLCEKV